jgi:hypothetical protein
LIKLFSRDSLVFGFIFVLCAAVVGAGVYSGVIATKELATSLLALLGTFLGATLAFRLNEDRESTKEQAARRLALNRALFVLARQQNAVQLISRELEPFQSDFERAFNFPAATAPPYTDLVHRFEDLEFLLETPEMNVLMRLTVEQERFHQVLESLRIRNSVYVEEVQPELAKHGFNGKTVSAEQVARAMGERVFGTAMHGARILQSHVADSMKSIPQMQVELRVVAKNLFPHHKFLLYQSEA